MGPTTIAELEAAFPALVAEIRSAARAAALTEARELVTMHLRFGRRSQHGGGLARAHKAIEALEPMTIELQEEYLAAAFRQRRIDDRQADDDVVGAALGGMSHGPAPTDHSALAAEIERQTGGAQ